MVDTPETGPLSAGDNGPGLNPDIPLGGAQRLHEPCRMLSGIFLPVFLTNNYGYCFVKRTKICS